ncbi:MAG: xanthine dehydrogenase family protein molybdopterin-binding subunit [Xanthomonadales bacterium]|nr:Isoquinoline 1-oxidoreductase subunit beta [Xanthomonadales bacterium]MCC6591740.1 xanthine dehydrogenase family protein molybdopterin-binding subunit [Xanthomonadales bacterium]MCE7929761.1 xanthine dehydrogenase family protein molybdopterin-binding subunit [Xanthomonadales bacterium PRO6]
MNEIVNLSRRGFIAKSSALAGALVLGVHLAPRGYAEQVNAAASGPVDLNAFLTVAADGAITVHVKHSEMGQGILTSIAMIVAEEMDADWQTIRALPGDARAEFAHSQWGIQATGGSTSTHTSYEQMRKVGASARAMLIAAAAAKSGIAAEQLKTADGAVLGPGPGQRWGYGELAADAAKLSPPADVALKDGKQFRLVGKAQHRLDGRAKVTGKAGFGIDVRVPGMLTALVARPPVFGGKLVKFDDSRARAVAGVRQVLAIHSGVAVVADHFWAAKQGLEALTVEWDDGAAAEFSSASQKAAMDASFELEGGSAKKVGDAAAALAAAREPIAAEYDFPYLSHAPLEPMNATAHVREDGVEVWAPTQFQTFDQLAAAKVAGTTPDKVVLHTTLLGGGFGRRANPASDFVAEAVAVSKAAGKPVKLVWTREHDLRGGYYRPRTRVSTKLALDADGKPHALQVKIANQSVLAGTPFGAGIADTGVDPSQVEGLDDWPYATPNLAVSYHMATATVPVLWWRSVGHSFSAYVKETLIDQAAARAKADPIDYRIGLLDGHPREIALLKKLREVSAWGKAAKGRHQGVAIHHSFGSLVGQVVEISIADGKLAIHKLSAVVDCGSVVNPDTVKAQIMGGALMGLSAALGEAVTFEAGKPVQSNFHDYPILRFAQAPAVEVHILESGAAMGGVGEPGTPPAAPALANALAAATGKWQTVLPLDLKALAG